MCNFCDKLENENLPIDYVKAKIQGKKLTIGYDAYSTDSSFDAELFIEFCPMCGSRLKELSLVKAEENVRIKSEYLVFDSYDRRNIYCKKGDDNIWVKAGNKREAKNKLNCALNEIKCLYTYRDLELRDMTQKNHSA